MAEVVSLRAASRHLVELCYLTYGLQVEMCEIPGTKDISGSNRRPCQVGCGTG